MPGIPSASSAVKTVVDATQFTALPAIPFEQEPTDQTTLVIFPLRSLRFLLFNILTPVPKPYVHP